MFEEGQMIETVFHVNGNNLENIYKFMIWILYSELIAGNRAGPEKVEELLRRETLNVRGCDEGDRRHRRRGNRGNGGERPNLCWI